VQGRLRKEHLSVQMSSQCTHCLKPLDLTIDSDLNVSVDQDTEPMVFIPEVKFFDLEDPSIIEAF
jgi:hypothetical protein